ncbi:Hypothetical Protein FCC1311_117892, partial [Hondaea fermentalgiana]
ASADVCLGTSLAGGVLSNDVASEKLLFIAAADDAMLADLRSFGSLLMTDATHNVSVKDNVKLITVMVKDDMGRGREVLFVVTNHETVDVYECIWRLLATLHGNRQWAPTAILSDMAPQPLKLRKLHLCKLQRDLTL